MQDLNFLKHFRSLFKWTFELSDIGLPGLVVIKKKVEKYKRSHFENELKKNNISLEDEEVRVLINTFENLYNSIVNENKDGVIEYYEEIKKCVVGKKELKFQSDFKIGAYYASIIEQELGNNADSHEYKELYKSKLRKK